MIWDNKKLILKKGVRYIGIAGDIYTALSWLDALAQRYYTPVPYLPKREYQLDSNSWIWRFPNGDVIAANPP